MTTTTYSPVMNLHHSTPAVKAGIFSRLLGWCDKQQSKRLMWTGIILPAQSCILAPLTMAISMLAGVHMFLFIPVMFAIGITFITNLAAMPTKVTIPVFAVSILVDIAVIAATFMIKL